MQWPCAKNLQHQLLFQRFCAHVIYFRHNQSISLSIFLSSSIRFHKKPSWRNWPNWNGSYKNMTLFLGSIGSIMDFLVFPTAKKNMLSTLSLVVSLCQTMALKKNSNKLQVDGFDSSGGSEIANFGPSIEGVASVTMGCSKLRSLAEYSKLMLYLQAYSLTNQRETKGTKTLEIKKCTLYMLNLPKSLSHPQMLRWSCLSQHNFRKTFPVKKNQVHPFVVKVLGFSWRIHHIILASTYPNST